MSEQEILPGLTGRQPSKIKPECASEESLLGDALSERDRDRIQMEAVGLWPFAFGLDIALLAACKGDAPEGWEWPSLAKASSV